MVIMVRPAKGGARVQVGGYNLQILWQDLGGGRGSELRFGPGGVERLKAMVNEHDGVNVILRVIRESGGEVIVSAADDALGGTRWGDGTS
jgi:hypothetical protein